MARPVRAGRFQGRRSARETAVLIRESELIRRARRLERKSHDGTWTWREIQASPAELNRLVVQGRLEVVTPYQKSRGLPSRYRVKP